LTTNEFENEFIPKIKMDRSSSNKMKKICKSNLIIKNRDLLPKSWATLYVLVSIEKNKLQELINIGDITTKTTKKQMLEIRDKINSPIEEDDNLADKSSNDGVYETNDESVNNRGDNSVGMPSSNNKDGDEPYRKLIIRFKEEEDFLDFTDKVNGLQLTDKTKSVYYKKSK